MDSIEIDAISQIQQTPKLRQQIKITITICTIYSLLLLGILSILLLIPSAPAASPVYQALYFTSYFEPSKIFYFFTLAFTGKIYVTSVTLKNYLRITRPEKDSNFEVFLFFLLCFFLFLFGGNATLAAYLQSTSYLSSLTYNYTCYTLPYVLFLHITYLISGVLIKVNISSEEIYKWSYRSWIFVILISLILVSLIGYQCYMLYLYSRILIYGAIYAFLFILISGFLYIIKDKYIIRDYFWLAMVAIPLTATPSIASAILQGAFFGIFVEGASRVGFSHIITSI